jgi:hypothetical protein
MLMMLCIGRKCTYCNAEALVVASKENGLEVNADKTQYIIMPWDQNAGQSHSIKTENSSLERMKEFI